MCICVHLSAPRADSQYGVSNVKCNLSQLSSRYLQPKCSQHAKDAHNEKIKLHAPGLQCALRDWGMFICRCFIILRIPLPNCEDRYFIPVKTFSHKRLENCPWSAKQIREEPAQMECILVNYGQPQKYLKILITVKLWASAVQSGNKAEK